MLRITGVFMLKKPTANRFSFFPIYWLWICIFLTLPLSAKDTLTLSDAVFRTFESHPDLQSFAHKFAAQQGRIVQAGLPTKLELGLTVEDVLGTGSASGIQSAQTTLSVSWVLNRKLREKQQDVARSRAKRITSQRDLKKLDVATQTVRHFLSALALQERIEIAKQAIELSQATEKEIQKRVNAGKAHHAELLRVQVQLENRKLSLATLEQSLTSAYHQLAAQWGSLKPTFQSVSGDILVTPNIIAFSALKTQMNANPELKLFLSQERIAEAELRLAEEKRNPVWRFSTGVRRMEATDDSGFLAGFSLPFSRKNRNQGQISEKRATLALHQSEASALRIKNEMNLYLFFQDLQRNVERHNQLKVKVIPKLEEALKETNKAYQLGKFSLLELLIVQNDLLNAQLSLLDSSLAAHQNKVEIERLTGARLTNF